MAPPTTAPVAAPIPAPCWVGVQLANARPASKHVINFVVTRSSMQFVQIEDRGISLHLALLGL